MDNGTGKAQYNIEWSAITKPTQGIYDSDVNLQACWAIHIGWTQGKLGDLSAWIWHISCAGIAAKTRLIEGNLGGGSRLKGAGFDATSGSIYQHHT